MLRDEVINRAIAQALNSTCIHKHGCVIYNRKSNILAEGYNYHTAASNTRKIMVHAEISALTVLKKNKSMVKFNNLKMLVIRIGGHGCSELKNSMPCNHCQNVILRSRFIQYVVYS